MDTVLSNRTRPLSTPYLPLPPALPSLDTFTTGETTSVWRRTARYWPRLQLPSLRNWKSTSTRATRSQSTLRTYVNRLFRGWNNTSFDSVIRGHSYMLGCI